MRIYLVAAEASGDLIGAGLARALREIEPDVVLAGVGQDAMAEEGITSLFDTKPISIYGLFEGFKILKLVRQLARQTAADVSKFEPDAVVLVDSWGFMIRVAWEVRALRPDIPLIKYVGPQVFAMRRRRVHVLARAVDHLLGIHPFDPDYFEPAGLPTTFVGNPALARMETGDGAAFRTRHGIAADTLVSLVLFGSRPLELERLYEDFAATVARVSAERPGVKFVTVLSPSLATDIQAQMAADPRMTHVLAVTGRERNDAFAAADMALACSGSVTLELGSSGVPMVVAYRLGLPTWILLRWFMFKAKYISLLNIAADEMLIDEYIQKRCNPQDLGDALIGLIDDPERRAFLSRRVREVTTEMRGAGGNPDENAARAVLSLINKPRSPGGA